MGSQIIKLSSWVASWTGEGGQYSHGGRYRQAYSLIYFPMAIPFREKDKLNLALVNQTCHGRFICITGEHTVSTVFAQHNQDAHGPDALAHDRPCILLFRFLSLDSFNSLQSNGELSDPYAMPCVCSKFQHRHNDSQPLRSRALCTGRKLQP